MDKVDSIQGTTTVVKRRTVVVRRRGGSVIRPGRRLGAMRRTTTVVAPIVYPGVPMTQYIAGLSDDDDEDLADDDTDYTQSMPQRYTVGLRFIMWALTNTGKEEYQEAARRANVPWDRIAGGWERAVGDLSVAKPERIMRFLLYLDSENRPALLEYIRSIAPTNIAPPASESSVNLARIADFVAWLADKAENDFAAVFESAFPQTVVGLELKLHIITAHMKAAQKIGWSQFARAISFVASLPPRAIVYLMLWAVPVHREMSMRANASVVL